MSVHITALSEINVLSLRFRFCTLAIPHIKDADRLNLAQVAVDGGQVDMGECMSQPQRDRSKRVDVRAKRLRAENVCELIN